MVRLEAIVSGRVQGVGFRAFVEVEALLLGLKGYVKNLPDGSVEVVSEGDEEKLEKLLAKLEHGNPLARVHEIRLDWSGAKGEFSGFTIRH